jgi:hypothetical protein
MAPAGNSRSLVLWLVAALVLTAALVWGLRRGSEPVTIPQEAMESTSTTSPPVTPPPPGATHEASETTGEATAEPEVPAPVREETHSREPIGRREWADEPSPAEMEELLREQQALYEDLPPDDVIERLQREAPMEPSPEQMEELRRQLRDAEPTPEQLEKLRRESEAEPSPERLEQLVREREELERRLELR